MKKYNENIFNPVIFYGVGLYPILALCVGLEQAVKFSLLLFITMVLCNLIINAFKPLLVKEVRIPCYVFLVIGIEYLLDSIIFEFWASQYSNTVPLLTMLFSSAIIIYMLEETTKKTTFKASITGCLKMATEYCFCMIVIAFVREILGSGSVWGKKIGGFAGLEFFNSFAGGLLLIMIYAAVYAIIAKSIKEKRVAFLGLVDRYTLLLENAGEEYSEQESKEGGAVTSSNASDSAGEELNAAATEETSTSGLGGGENE